MAIRNAIKANVTMAPTAMRSLILLGTRKLNNSQKGVDVAYIDVAQPFQAKILADNADVYLVKGGHVMLVIKAMSIDVTKEPSETFKREIDTLKERGFDIVNMVHLEPYDVAHALVIGRKQ